MKPPCLLMVNKFIPILRKRISKNLSEKGYTQNQIADILGITQAMVSKYLKEPVENEELNLESLSKLLSDKISNDYPEEELITDLCKNCLEWREDGTICSVHREYHDLSECRVCMDLRNQETSEKRSKILNSLNRVIELMNKDSNFTELIPEVRSNIAYALPKASKKSQIAAIPGRITKVKDRAIVHSKAEFGASDHLSSIILPVLKASPETRSILDIKYEEDFKDILDKENLNYQLYDREKGSKIKEDIIEIFEGKDLDALIDPGGFGIEPIIYLFGRDPITVYEKARKISKNL